MAHPESTRIVELLYPWRWHCACRVEILPTQIGLRASGHGPHHLRRRPVPVVPLLPCEVHGAQNFRAIERARQHIVRAKVQRLCPKMVVGKSRSDDQAGGLVQAGELLQKLLPGVGRSGPDRTAQPRFGEWRRAAIVEGTLARGWMNRPESAAGKPELFSEKVQQEVLVPFGKTNQHDGGGRRRSNGNSLGSFIMFSLGVGGRLKSGIATWGFLRPQMKTEGKY